MNRALPDGGTLRDAFRSYRIATKRPHPMEARMPRRPRALFYLYEWFLQLSRSRPVSHVGFLPIPCTEIEAWGRLYRIRPAVWELDVLAKLDDVWLETMSNPVTLQASDEFDDEPIAPANPVSKRLGKS